MAQHLTDTQIEVIRRIDQLFKRWDEVSIDHLLMDDYLEVFTPEEIEEAVVTCSFIKTDSEGYIIHYPTGI
jgi:hypothetical protein